MTDEIKTPIQFITRYDNRLFTKWKGGRYCFYLYDNEVNLYHWVFENNLQNEIKFIGNPDTAYAGYIKHRMDIYFKTGETFMAFKLQWV